MVSLKSVAIFTQKKIKVIKVVASFATLLLRQKLRKSLKLSQNWKKWQKLFQNKWPLYFPISSAWRTSKQSNTEIEKKIKK